MEATDAVLTEGPMREGAKEQVADSTTVIGPQDSGPDTPTTPQRPPPMPDSEPPMFTPYKPTEGTSSGSPPQTSKSSPHDATFDYSGLVEPATSKSEAEDDFEFLAPDCPPPAPPLDDSARLTPPPLPVSFPPGLDSPPAGETAVVAPSEVLENAPTMEMFTKLLDDDSLILGSTSSRRRNMGKKMTPRGALDEAFKQLDTDGPDDAYSSEDELDPTYSTVCSRPASDNKAPPTPSGDGETSSDVFPPEGMEMSPADVKDVSELYAKVNNPQLRRAARIETWPRTFPDDQAYATVEIPEEGDMPIYAKVDKSRKMRRTVGLSPEDADTKRFSFGEVVGKAASVGDVHAVQYAEVDGPKRSSMIEHQYHAVTTTPPAPPSPATAGPLDVTFEEDWERLQENEKSLKKLEEMFGPEFSHLSGRAKKAPDTKVSAIFCLPSHVA